MRWLFEPPPHDLSDRLCAMAHEPDRPNRAGLVLVLLVLCLLPRAWMAWKIDVVCPDAVLYLDLAASIDRGDVESSLSRLGLNTFPPILAVLHGLGLDWETAGKLWGVSTGSLVVLPLFGWLRRQFDDRVATLACLLYACHPKLIEWSPEILRDPTFWLLWTTSLYFIWRAVTEGRILWFAVTGVVVALALHTRFEGWFLYVPLVSWAGWRLLKRPAAGPRVIVGVAVAAAVCPLLVWTVNVTWLRHRAEWELGNFDRAVYALSWARSTLGVNEPPAEPSAQLKATVASASVPPPPAARTPATPALSSSLRPLGPPPRMSTVEALWSFGHTARRGCGAVFSLLMLVGVCGWFHVWRRADYQPLFWTALCVMTGIWIHQWYGQATSSRYWLSIVVLGCPFAALGLARVAEWLARVSQRRTSFPLGYKSVLSALLAGCLVFGWSDALSSDDAGRRGEAALGRWIAQRGAGERVVVLPATMPVCRYYSGVKARGISVDSLTYAPVDALALSQPAVAVLSRRKSRAEICRAFISCGAERGFTRVADNVLPAECDASDLIVLIRDQPPRLAERAVSR